MSHLVHLAGRFFRSLGARRPGPQDQLFVAALLRPRLADAFWMQPVADLAQAVRGARRIETVAPERTDLIRAFLLHDVGKRQARLGTMARSLVTAARLVRLPVGRRGRAYLEHGEIGATELASLGAGELAIAFARHHHGSRPDGVEPEDWTVLVNADRA